MAKCKNCKHLCTMQNYKKESYKWCSLIDDCPQEDIERECDFYVPMTNADRIRNMMDEELAKWFDTVTKDVLGGSTWDKNGWLKWLKAESEE